MPELRIPCQLTTYNEVPNFLSHYIEIWLSTLPRRCYAMTRRDKIWNPGPTERVMPCRHTVDLRTQDDTILHNTRYGLLCICTRLWYYDFFIYATPSHQNLHDIGSSACVTFFIYPSRLSPKHGTSICWVDLRSWEKFCDLRWHGKERVSDLKNFMKRTNTWKGEVARWLDWLGIACLLTSISLLFMIWFIWRRRTDGILMDGRIWQIDLGSMDR
jgi:hypothetical protein